MKDKNIPKLRFPEFVESGQWEMLNGNKLFEPITNKNHNSDLPLLAITQEQGAVPRDMINYNVIATDKSIESYKVVEVGDFIISLRSFQGGIEYSNYLGLCSPAYIILRKKESIENIFYKYYFKTSLYIKHLNKHLEGIRDGKMISYKQFSDILIPYPSLPEQQKIASCLSSLDDLIEAESQKLELLKTYKKGLMQNLFPQEGETVPKIRFPEFVNEEEWEERKLGEVAEKVIKKNKDSVIKDVYTNSAIRGVVNQRDYFDKDIANQNNLQNYYIIELNDFVYNPRKSNEAPFGPISINKIGIGAVSPLYYVFRFKIDNVSFFEQFFKTSYWFSHLKEIGNKGARDDRMSFSKNDFYNMPILLPTIEEQQKIASCLSSIDALIEAQGKRIASLHAHKKGLMQGLFPSPQ